MTDNKFRETMYGIEDLLKAQLLEMPTESDVFRERKINRLRERLEDCLALLDTVSDTPTTELEDLRLENDILSYKVHRYEHFLKTQGYNIVGETIVVCEDDES